MEDVADNTPVVESEAFVVDGEFGYGATPGCFVCAGPHLHRNILTAFTHDVASGERVVELFPRRGAFFHRCEHGTHTGWVQVHVGSCDTHLPNLEKLRALTANGIINRAIVDEARE